MSSAPAIPGLSGGLPQCQISLSYQGGDVSSIIQPNLLRLSYHDRINYQADSLEFTIADPEGIFRQQFTFQSGNSLKFGLSARNFRGNDYFSQNYGEFAITRFAPGQSSSGSVVDIRCSSIPISHFRLEMKFQRWQQSKLQDLASQIASDNSMTLDYEASTNPTIAAIEQYDESDMVFLARVAQTFGMSIKVKNNILILFSRKDYESRAPKGTITFPPNMASLLSAIANPISSAYGVNGAGGMLSWSASDNLDGIFKDCRVVIRSPYSGLTAQSLFDDPNNPPVVATLNKRQNIYPPSYPAAQSSPSVYYDGPQGDQQANLIAYNELRRRAEKRHSLMLTVPLALNLEAADVWVMQGIGQDFDGSFILLDAEQLSGESGSQTKASFERVLGW